MNEAVSHLVRVSFEPVSKEEMNLLLLTDGQLNVLFNDPSTVEYDGFERGHQDFVMYFYGTDADEMVSAIFPELRKLPFRNKATVLKRYGINGAREETVKLN